MSFANYLTNKIPKMKRFNLFALLLLLIPSLVSAQQKDSLTKKLDSLSKKTDSTGGKQKNNINPAFL